MKEKQLRWMAVVLLCAVFPISGISSQSGAQRAKVEVKIPATVKTPLPSKVTILPPDSSLPPEASVFSGIWIATLGGPPSRDATLVVQKISAADSKGMHKVDLIYSSGTVGGGSYPWQKANEREFDGELKQGELQMVSGSINIRWKLQPDGSLAGEWQDPRFAAASKATFTKVSE